MTHGQKKGNEEGSKKRYALGAKIKYKIMLGMDEV